MKNRLLFFIIIAIQTTAFNFAHPVTPTLIKNLNLNSSTFGISFSSMAITCFLFSQFWSYVCEKVDDRWVYLIGCTFYAFGQYLFASSTNLLQLVIARLIDGTFVAAINISTLVYIIRNTTEANRGENLMIFATISSVTAAIGYLIGGYVGNTNIFISFYFQIFILILCGILFVVFLSKNELPNTNKQLTFSDINPFSVFKIEGSNKLLILLFIITFLSVGGSTIYDQTLNYYLKDIFNFTPVNSGLIKAISGLLILLVNSTITLYIMKRKKNRIGLIIVFITCALSLLRMITTRNLLEFQIVNYILVALNSINVPIIQEEITLIGKNNKNIAGTYNGLKSLGWIIGGFVAGGAYTIHHNIPFLITTIIFMICSILVFSSKNKAYR